MNISGNTFTKKIISLFFALILVTSLFGCTPDEGANEETSAPKEAKFSIGLILSDNTKEYESAYRGFVRAFSEKGYTQGDYYSLSFADCDGSKQKCKETAQKYADDGVDLIFAIGEKAAYAAKKATNSIPVIFCSVYDPIESKILKSCEKPEGNVTGVSDFTPVEEQFAFIRRVLPKAKNISSLHLSTDANSILITTLAKSASESLEFEYTPFSATDTDRLESVLKDALKDADALYICEDELTVANAEMIVEAANKKKVPIFAASDTFMSFGTFATCVPDCEHLGFNAGELALICLKELHPISNISVEYPVKCIGYISQSVADELDIKVEALDEVVILP